MKLQHHLTTISDIPNAFDIKHFDKKIGNKYFFHSSTYYFEIIDYTRVPMVNYTTNNSYGMGYFNMSDIQYDAFLELAAECDTHSKLQSIYGKPVSTSLVPDPNSPSNTLVASGTWEDYILKTEGESKSSDNSVYCSCKTPEVIDNHALGKAFKVCKCCKKEYLEPISEPFKWY